MNPRSPSLLYRLFISLLLCWAVHGTAFSQQAGAELAPSPLMKHETRWLVGALEQAHFSKVSVDKLKPEERCASTSNRNFEGRQGRGGRTHLVSPGMAAAAAISGNLDDVRKYEN